MKQKQINKVINLWRKAKQESITYDVNGKENGINLSLAKDSFIEKLEKIKVRVRWRWSLQVSVQ